MNLARRYMGIAVGILLFGAGTAQAYIMSSTRVIRRSQRALQTLNIQQVAGLGHGWRGQQRVPFSYGERWIFGSVSQVDTNGPRGQKSAWHQGQKPSGDQEFIAPESLRTVFPMLFGQADLPGLVKKLKINTDKQRLTLMDENVCIVIGCEHDCGQTSQIWIDQVSFLPRLIRFIDQGQRIDIRLTQWSSKGHTSTFPREISLRVNRRLTRTFKVSTVRRREVLQQ